MMKYSVVAAAALATAVSAQSPVYGQCGGIGWSGATTCASGSSCVVSNPYYSQCLPGSGGGSPASTTTKATTTTSTIKSVSSATKSTPTTIVTSTKSTVSTTTKSASSASAPSTTATPAAGNPFAGYQMYANPYYASEVNSIAIPSLTGTLVAKASAAAKVPSFTWLDTISKVPTVGTYLADIKAQNAAGASPPIMGIFVVYDLPERDCAALASNGELSLANDGITKYKGYIDDIVAQIAPFPDVNVALVVEPDSLGNLVTNMNVPKCANAASAYKTCITYAMQQLSTLKNVHMYLDAGHAGWLGWDANLQPAADLYNSLYKAAGSPSGVRGLATNVANYNAWTSTSCASYTQGDKNCNEQLYVHALAPLLTAGGFPAHFVTDTSRNGVQPTAQLAWGDWCNVKGTGFGLRPSANTGDSLLDAFVWVKPGGECDGTSNTTAVRYDSHCGLADALQPAPEAGTWFQAYFQQLLQNANPSF